MKEIIIQSLIDARKDAEAATLYTVWRNVSDEEKAKAEAEKEKRLEAMREKKAYKELEKALDEAQHRCTARTITIADILTYAERIEHYLDIPKSHMDNVRATVDIHHEEPYHKRYTTPVSTHFQLEYRCGKWRVTRIWRDYIGRSHEVYISLTPEAKTALASRFNTMD